MKTLIALILSSVLLHAADPVLKELDMGASRNIQYRILRDPAIPDMIYMKLENRTNMDIRLRYQIIPGAGDGTADIEMTAIIPKNGHWPVIGSGRIKCAYKLPGVRIAEIEEGTITEEEGIYYDADGNETYSRIIKFKPKSERSEISTK